MRFNAMLKIRIADEFVKNKAELHMADGRCRIARKERRFKEIELKSRD